MRRYALEIRHGFSDFEARPTVRIALGAYLAGDLAFADLNECITSCPGRGVSFDLPLHLDRL